MSKRLGIKHRFAPVCYPQANGHVEVMNRTIFQGIKKNLLDSGARWYEELPRLLWSYRTTPSNATGETPFRLVFGTEAVLPVEVCFPNIRQICFDVERNEERMKECLHFTNELRDQALYRMQSGLNPIPHVVPRVKAPQDPLQSLFNTDEMSSRLHTPRGNRTESLNLLEFCDEM
ncbi:hypothetical protein LIER_41890 [Lithospermum erythrorhizon]|uniref:Integrase catalytic domain-containing protein n=1 Tax=Lithospermum erythrorhizon TaxID=34254 RepID=A0AAV3RHS2_LITER